MVAQTLEDFGGIDILVNNAGIASRGKNVADTDPQEMERVVRVHAFGPHYLSKLVVPHMRDRGRGDIVMISSVATLGYGANGAPPTTTAPAASNAPSPSTTAPTATTTPGTPTNPPTTTATGPAGPGKGPPTDTPTTR